MSLYTLYLDESGDEGKYNINQDMTKDGISRFFTIGGIIVEDKNIPLFRKRMDELLEKYFHNIDHFNKFKLHYNDFLQSKHPFDKMTGLEKKAVADDIFNIVKEINCYLLSVTIDLYKHYYKCKDRYATRPRAYSIILIKRVWSSMDI